MKPKRVLYVHHASALGGASKSLLYTAQGLDPRRYTPIVALAQPAPEVAALYTRAGIPVVPWPGIQVWNHVSTVPRPLSRPSTWLNLAEVAATWGRTQERTAALLAEVKPDLVHLNASVLVAAAGAVKMCGYPLLWHVRDHPAPELAPWRTALFRAQMTAPGHQMIFISEADRAAWMGSDQGEVIHNFVDFARYDRRVDGHAARAALGIPQDAPVLLYVGGLNLPKGAFTLLRALAHLKKRLPAVRCIAPGSVYPPPTGLPLRMARALLPRLGTGTTVQRAQQAVRALGLTEQFLALPYRHDMPELIAAADVLVFPATVPHFARPVVEAAAMGKPAIASDLPGLRELIVHGETGFLTPEGDARALSTKLHTLLTQPALARRLGDQACDRAKRLFNAEINCQRVMALYDRALSSEVAATGTEPRAAAS